MLTSILSIYIASLIQKNVVENIGPPPEIVKIEDSSSEDFEGLNKLPTKDPLMISPIIDAKSSLAMDINTGMVLYEKNINARLPIASITKLMTIMIILEENNLDDVVKISHNAASTGGTSMGLRPGEKIKVKNLLLGALIQSANDAAIALAEYNSETVEAFIEKMNTKALTLGLLNTHYSNPAGLDDKNNYSSAYDLAKLSRYVYQKQFIKQAAGIKDTKVTSVEGAYTHNLTSTNDLLGNKYYKVKGLKTGTTDAAGLCLISIAENDKGNEILTIVLDSPARFTETKIIIDWIFRAYTWQ